MITLAGISLGENLYLSGLESASLATYTQNRLLGGSSTIFIQPKVGGRTLTLKTMTKAGTMGLWCMSVIESLKVYEQAAGAVTLDYHGDTYNVLIVKMDFEPFLQNEPEGPNKAFTGSITFIEV